MIIRHQYRISIQGEGVAYRGRALVELETKLDVEMLKSAKNLQSDEIIRVQVRMPKSALLSLKNVRKILVLKSMYMLLKEAFEPLSCFNFFLN